MKSFLKWVLIVFVISLIVAGLQELQSEIDFDFDFNFSFLDKRTTKERLLDAIEERAEEWSVAPSKWDDSMPGSWSETVASVEDVLNETPELFWVNFRDCKMSGGGTVGYGNQDFRIELDYLEELDNDMARGAVEYAAQQILNQVPAYASDWEKALIIHDLLVRHVTYEEGPYDQNIYGALVEGKAVCNGFAMAYEYLLNKAGIPCDTVIGYSDFVQQSLSEFGSSRHAWSIITLGNQSYYVDTTWDNTDLYDVNGQEFVRHEWFCLSQAQMDASGRNVVEDIYDYDQWDLTWEDCNYYVVKNAIVTQYDLNAIAQMLQAQINEGSTMPTVRWASRDAYIIDRINLEEGDISELVGIMGLGATHYSFTNSIMQSGNYCMSLMLNMAS